MQVHPNFRVIFTSNPEEYVGVHKSQDALIDRMITLEVAHQDRETEMAIVKAKSRRPAEEVAQIVDIIRAMRERLGSKNGPTIRAALAIARILDHRHAKVASSDPIFMTTCQDVLLYNASRQAGVAFTKTDLERLVRSVLLPGVMTSSKLDSSKSGVKSSSASVTAMATPPTPAGNMQPSAKAELRIDTQLNNLDASIEELKESMSAESALGTKDAVVRPNLEKQVDQAKATDQVSDGDATREPSSRRLQRPPAFETSHVPNGSAVSSR